jgi:uncharacterized protein YjiS (DUF1127 family)
MPKASLGSRTSAPFERFMSARRQLNKMSACRQLSKMSGVSTLNKMSTCRQLNKNVVVDNEKNVGPPTIALAASKQFPELKKILFHVKQILFERECHSNGASFESGSDSRWFVKCSRIAFDFADNAI